MNRPLSESEHNLPTKSAITIGPAGPVNLPYRTPTPQACQIST